MTGGGVGAPCKPVQGLGWFPAIGVSGAGSVASALRGANDRLELAAAIGYLGERPAGEQCFDCGV